MIQCICRMEGLQSLIRAKIMLGGAQTRVTGEERGGRRRLNGVPPVQVDEEAEQVIPQLDHGLLHVGLELTTVVDLSGIKHAHVPHRNLHAPEGRAGVTDLHSSTQEELVSHGYLKMGMLLGATTTSVQRSDLKVLLGLRPVEER